MHWLLLGQLLEDLGNFFIPTSGHTDCQSRTVLSFVPIYLFARVFIGLSGIVHVCVNAFEYLKWVSQVIYRRLKNRLAIKLGPFP